jgi:large subunit ribosomal protein L10
MNREEKAAVIEEVAGEIGASDAIFALDYRGITVSQVGTLREKLRDTDTKLRVVKNSLSERAADQAGAGELKSLLVGPTALALVKGDAAAAAKVLSDTARDLRGPLEFKGGFMNGALLSAGDVQMIAKLPSRDVLNAQLVGTIAAPLSGLVRTLNALISGLALQLGQIAEQGLVSGSAAPEVTPEAAPVIDASAEAEITEASAEASTTEAADAPAGEGDATAAEEAEPATEAAPEPEAEAEAAVEPEAETSTETETEGASDDEPSDE